MNNLVTSILDAAERRMRTSGVSGFSHREIAADVGIKSSSVHYHFPTKDDLSASVVRRYRERAAGHFQRELERGPDPITAFKRIFRETAYADGQLCPYALLGAAALDLPPRLAQEVKLFFQMCLDKMVAFGASPDAAKEALWIVIGTLVLSAALGGKSNLARASEEMVPHVSSA